MNATEISDLGMMTDNGTTTDDGTMNDDRPLSCPHCGSELSAFDMPVETGWDQGFHCACFNDDCSYFKEGWTWMRDRYGVNASYRYRVNPGNGHASPMAVWSADALKDRIL